MAGEGARAPVCIVEAADAPLRWHVDGVRRVDATVVVGRDVREAARIVLAAPALFDRVRHVRELLLQRRADVLVLVRSTDPHASGLPALRLHAGRVATDVVGLALPLQGRLLCPVHQLDAELPGESLSALIALPCGNSDAVEQRLHEARQWFDRGEVAASFSATARALTNAPDQPGTIADAARLLTLLGHPEQANLLCRSFLAQRPDAEVVRAAWAELAACAPEC